MDAAGQESVKAVLPSGEFLWVKVKDTREAPAGGYAQDAGGLRDRLRRRDPDTPVPLSGFTEAIHGIARSVHDGLQSIAPHSVEIEFGLDIEIASGELVSMLADVHATSSIRITLGWENGRARQREGDQEGSGEDDHSDGDSDSDGPAGPDGTAADSAAAVPPEGDRPRRPRPGPRRGRR